MPRYHDWQRDVEPDPEDVALLEHILDEDRPPQGLHQHGFKPFGEPEPWEDDAVDDYLYPRDLEI